MLEQSGVSFSEILNLLETAGVIGGLIFTAHTIKRNAAERRVANLLELTRSHREIWTQLVTTPALKRVLDKDVDLEKEPVTQEERIWVLLVILHVNAVLKAKEENSIQLPSAFEDDIIAFFALPLPKRVWKEVRPFQDQALIQLVEKNKAL